MARRSRVWAVAALMGGAMVCLSACTDEPVRTVYVTLSPAEASETPAPGASSTSGPSPTSGPSAPALTDDQLVAMIPKAAQKQDFFGASAFAKFFMCEYRQMVSTGDSGLFEAMAAPGCTFCVKALGEREPRY